MGYGQNRIEATMKKMAVLLGLCALTACTTSRQITLPDGSQGKMVQCNGTLNDMASCQIEAGKACPAGYTVIDGNERRGIASMPNGAGGINQIATESRSLLIKCRA